VLAVDKSKSPKPGSADAEDTVTTEGSLNLVDTDMGLFGGRVPELIDGDTIGGGELSRSSLAGDLGI
jgi:hypothetical protein